MSDSLLPFRPRASSAVDRALGNVETQTSHVRRRLNRFSLQHALYLAGSAVLLAFSALVALAFVLHARSFAVAVWLIAVGVAGLMLVDLRRVRRVWISRLEAAVVIDHRAGLEDRLATLSAPAARAGESRLWEFLLHENLRLLPHWGPQRMAPRAVPLSVWFFLLSLIVAALILRSHLPGLRGGGSDGLGSGPDGTQPIADLASDAAAEASGEPSSSGSSSLFSELPEKLRQAIVAARQQSQQSGEGRDQKSADGGGGASIAMNGSSARGGAAKPARPGSDRSLPPETVMGRSASGTNAKQAPTDPNRPPSAAAKPSSQPARGEGPKALERVEVGRSPQPPPARGPHAKGQQTGSSGGAGAGFGGDPTSLFGDKDAPGKAGGSFALDLDATANRQPSKEGEDQQAGARPASRLGADQRLDDAIRRAQVPAEYERIVQRIFNRGEEPESGPAPQP